MNIGIQDVSNGTGSGISAAGTTQATATLLIAGLTVVGTVAASSGVVLYPSVPGACQIVYNGGANSLTVYPTLGAKINGLATNGGHVLATNTACQYWAVSSTQYVGVLSA